ncbi:hypothetical protein BH23PLA1_BH23PLA1_30270 [soil metagenome]
MEEWSHTCFDRSHTIRANRSKSEICTYTRVDSFLEWKPNLGCTLFKLLPLCLRGKEEQNIAFQIIDNVIRPVPSRLPDQPADRSPCGTHCSE